MTTRRYARLLLAAVAAGLALGPALPFASPWAPSDVAQAEGVRFAYNWRGTYAAGTQYITNDLVNYGGSVYRAKAASLGQTPSSSTTYWEVFVSKGTDGTPTGYSSLAAIKAATPANGDRALLQDQGIYRFNSASSATANDANVILPTSGVGRWLLEVPGVTFARGVSVREYGAIPDDGVDDTAQIQAAIDANKQVFLPAGVYHIVASTGIVVRDGLTLYGAGKAQTILFPTAAAGSVIKRAGPTSRGQYITDVTIRDLGIVMNHPATAAPGNYEQIAFDFRHITRSVIQDCYAGNENRGNALAYHAAPTSQANSVQGYGLVFGAFTSSPETLYSGGEVNAAQRCTIWGAKKAIVLDDAVLSPLSASHATSVTDCDIQACEGGIVQELPYATGCSFTGNTIQAVLKATGSSNTTYAMRIEGYSNRAVGGYSEVTTACDFGLYLGANSKNNYVRPPRISGATTDISDLGAANDVVVSDDTDTKHHGKQRFLRGLKVEGGATEVGTWTTSGWPLNLQLGAPNTNTCLRFPICNGTIFGFTSAPSDGRIRLIRSTASDASATGNPDWVIDPAGRAGFYRLSGLYPTALVHVGAGVAAASGAPLKIDIGTLLTSPEVGAIEYDGTYLFYTTSTLTRCTVANRLTATATLDFPNTVAQTGSELTITVTGATAGDAVMVGPPAALEAGLSATGYVSAANTVTVRVCNFTAGAIDPASATWRATVVR